MLRLAWIEEPESDVIIVPDINTAQMDQLHRNILGCGRKKEMEMDGTEEHLKILGIETEIKQWPSLSETRIRKRQRSPSNKNIVTVIAKHVLTCQYCDKEYTSEQSYLKHLNLHSKEQKESLSSPSKVSSSRKRGKNEDKENSSFFGRRKRPKRNVRVPQRFSEEVDVKHLEDVDDDEMDQEFSMALLKRGRSRGSASNRSDLLSQSDRHRLHYHCPISPLPGLSAPIATRPSHLNRPSRITSSFIPTSASSPARTAARPSSRRGRCRTTGKSTREQPRSCHASTVIKTSIIPGIAISLKRPPI